MWASGIVALLEQSEKRTTVTQTAALWRNKVPDPAVRGKQPPAGVTKEGCERLLIQMLVKGVLAPDYNFTAYSTNVYLKPGPHAAQARAGRANLSLVLPPQFLGKADPMLIAAKEQAEQEKESRKRAKSAATPATKSARKSTKGADGSGAVA